MLDVGIVLDDAVVDDGQVVTLGVVRVGVACRGFAVSSPARVGDAHVARHIFIAAILREVVDLTFCLIHIQVAVLANQGYAGTIVATIFQTLQSFHQNGVGLLGAYIPYNSTHSYYFF